MGKLCKVMYQIEGIYGYGDGYYSSDLAGAWNKFWEDMQGKKTDDLGTFKVGYMNEDSDVIKHPILYGDSGTFFCHPMTTEGVLHSCNSSETEKFEYERNAIFNFLKDKLAPFIKEKTGVKIKVTENYFVFTPPRANWIVENKTE